MGDDLDRQRLARAEERLEYVTKRIDNLEEDIRDRLDERFTDLKARIVASEMAVTSVINGRIKELDAKYLLVRGIVLGACSIVLVAFMGAVVAHFVGAQLRPPTLPQPYTIQPRTPQ